MVSNLFPRLSNVRSSSEHAFVCHYSDSKVIDLDSVILPAHDFRGHIARCARSVLGIFFTPDSCNTEISDSNIS